MAFQVRPRKINLGGAGPFFKVSSGLHLNVSNLVNSCLLVWKIIMLA